MTILIGTLANKPTLLPEALASVAAQTRKDYLHVVHMDGGGWPAQSYPPAVFANRYMRLAQPGDYVAWISDDDRWEAHYLETLAGFLDTNPRVSACYGGSRLIAYDPETQMRREVRMLPADRIYDARCRPSCMIDGGQVMFRQSVIAEMEPPWLPEGLDNCNIVDGTFLNRIADLVPIVPVQGSWIMENRITPLSSHWRLVDGTPTFMTGETQARLRGEV